MKKQAIMIVITFFMGFWPASAGNSIIHTEVRGAGQPMILIHGMACSADVWEDVAAYYGERYELHLVSIAGFGNDGSVDAPNVLQAIRDEIIEYTQSRALHKPILMGHSMGGFLSLWAAAEAPGLFGKIISVDGLPYFPVLSMPGTTPDTAGPIVEMMQNNMRNSTPEAARAQQEMMVATMIGDPEKRTVVLEMGVQSNPDVIARAMGEMYTTDIRNQVSAIEIPLLALGSWYGYRQWGVTKASASSGYLAQFDPIPNASIKMAATALHFIFYDEPEWFFEVLDGFLVE